MALTREQMDAKLDEHFGFELAGNVDGVLATLTEDVEHDIVGPAVLGDPDGAAPAFDAGAAAPAEGQQLTLGQGLDGVAGGVGERQRHGLSLHVPRASSQAARAGLSAAFCAVMICFEGPGLNQ